MDKQTKEKISNRMSQVGIGEKLGVSSQAVGKWLRKRKHSTKARYSSLPDP